MNTLISPCGKYRYTLKRPPLSPYPDKGTAVFCMLNPSTADATADDPTIRRCRGFADHWGCNGIVVINLYALRSTDPKGLWGHIDPIGPENDLWLKHVAHAHGTVVCAWGANARQDRVERVVSIFHSVGANLLCLGKTKNGSPRHPLYVRADQKLIHWSVTDEKGVSA